MEEPIHHARQVNPQDSHFTVGRTVAMVWEKKKKKEKEEKMKKLGAAN